MSPILSNYSSSARRLGAGPLVVVVPLALVVAFASVLVSSCSDDEEPAAGANAAPDNSGDNNVSNNNNNQDNNQVNNQGNNGATPMSCTSTADCGENEACDTSMNICAPSCGDDSDCLPVQRCGAEDFCVARAACEEASGCTETGEVCNTCDGRCELSPEPGARSCTTDMNCLFEEFCDPCRSICRPLGEACDPCIEDVQCDDGLCLDFQGGGRFCGQSCTDDDSCPRGFVCASVGGGGSQCLPRSGDCASPGECEDETDCPAGMRCGPQFTCVAGCTEGTCPNMEVCDFGVCKPPCGGAADCPTGAECTPEGLCRVPGGCLTSRDCVEPGTFCNTDTLMCEEGCADDGDCPGLQVCRQNSCITRPCDGNYLCAFGQVCNQESGMCEMAEGPHCEMCDAMAENQCGGEPNMCLSLQDEDGNALGDFCGVACTPGDLDACPVGYSCQELMDQDMMVTGAVCFRACHRDPV